MTPEVAQAKAGLLLQNPWVVGRVKPELFHALAEAKVGGIPHYLIRRVLVRLREHAGTGT